MCPPSRGPEKPVSTVAARAAVASMCLAAASGCAPANAYQPPPPIPVTVAHPLYGTLVDAIEQDGVVSGVQQVEIRAQVQGTITGIHFENGQEVEVGQALFTIDPRPYRVALQQAQARVRSQRAEARFAEVSLQRARRLQKQDAISEQVFDEAEERDNRARADLSQGRAAVDAARIRLDYTQVTSPIRGRISRRLVDQGALVGHDGPTLMARVINASRVYVDFAISQNEVLSLRDRVRADPERKKARGEAAADEEIVVPVEVGLANEEGFPHRGVLESVANTLSATTGTLELRAVLENADRGLAPGLFCRVRVPIGRAEGLLIPEVATGLDQVGRYVYVVVKKEGEDRVERRDVVLGGQDGAFRRIQSGLAREDRVVINGMARLRVGAKVAVAEETLSRPNEPAAVEERSEATPPAEADAP